MVEALRVSCDVYFYEAGIRLGMDTLADYAYQLGFGQRSGIGIGAERAGLVPTREWHNTHTPGGFVGGFTLGAVIGQDVVQVSPLQLAMSYAAIANGGSLYYPRLVDRVTTTEGRVVFEYPRRIRNVLPFSPENTALVVEGLQAVMRTGGGRRWETLPYVSVAGKTGTAQVASLDTLRFRDDQIIWKQRDHAWLAAFAPVEDPRIAVAVLVEHGGSGSAVAAPIALKIMDTYFRDVLGWDEEISSVTAGRMDPASLAALMSTPRVDEFAEGDFDVDAEFLLSRHARGGSSGVLEARR